MANYYAQARSNYFRVKNPEAFLDWAEDFDLRVLKHNTPENETLYGVMPSANEDGWPNQRCTLKLDENGYEDVVETVEVDFVDELSHHLVAGEVAVLMQIGSEAHRYLTGEASRSPTTDVPAPSISTTSTGRLRKSLGFPIPKSAWPNTRSKSSLMENNLEAATTEPTAVEQLKAWFATNRDMLAESGVASIEATYSGSGDEGFYNGSSVCMANDNAQRYALTDRAETLLSEAIDELTGETGYENGEGGGGSLTLDVATGKIVHQSYYYLTEKHDDEEEEL